MRAKPQRSHTEAYDWLGPTLDPVISRQAIRLVIVSNSEFRSSLFSIPRYPNCPHAPNGQRSQTESLPCLSIDRFFELLTKFGDQGFVLPFLLAVGAVLWHGDARRETLWWFVANGAALGAVLILKLVFVPCGHLLPGWDIRSPSGHAGAAFAAFGGFAVLEAKFRRNNWLKVAIVSAGFGFALLIAFSRLFIHVHSVPEVLLGSLMGLMAPVLLVFIISPDARRNLANPLGLAPLLPLALLFVFDGRTLPVEEHVSSIALWLAQFLGVCA